MELARPTSHFIDFGHKIEAERSYHQHVLEILDQLEHEVL